MSVNKRELLPNALMVGTEANNCENKKVSFFFWSKKNYAFFCNKCTSARLGTCILICTVAQY
jgi:hypothetical protein